MKRSIVIAVLLLLVFTCSSITRDTMPLGVLADHGTQSAGLLIQDYAALYNVHALFAAPVGDSVALPAFLFT
jgi:hypothetical protein